MQPKELVKKIPDNTRKAKDVEIAPFPSLYLFYKRQSVGGGCVKTQTMRAESPISPQPRATPWVYSIHLTTRPVRATLTFHCFLQLPLQGALVICIRLPRAMPWAMKTLGFQPVSPYSYSITPYSE